MTTSWQPARSARHVLPVPSNQTRAHHGAQRMRRAPREQLPRRHRSDLRDLRIVRHPRQVTEREYIAVGTKDARSSQGAAATMTSRRVRRASPPPSDRPRVHHGGHEECAELPGSSRHNDIAATCATCVSCIACTDQMRAPHTQRA
jgi:hypothetical protein